MSDTRVEPCPRRGRPPTYRVETYGCQMNVRDSEILAGLFESAGYSEAERIEEADVIVLNTCCVRETAEERILGRIAQLKRLKLANPDLILCVAGCMAQQEGMAERIRRRHPHVDIVLGTHNVHELPSLVEGVRRMRQPIHDVWPCERGIVERLPSRRAPGVTAYVTIMYGCNNFCSYCIVPYVRGRERSRLPHEIISEVREAADRGYKEILLLGQNVNSYGRDLGTGEDFAALLERLDGIAGIERIRYMTSHPRDFNDRLIAVIAGSRKVCEHFHLPVQAGSNKILSLMNRGYTREHYLDLVQRIRRAIPGSSITTDIIVGFPGETEKDFDETLDLVQKARFDMTFTFMYSKRKGTPAATMPEQVPLEEKRRRLSALIQTQNPISLEINRALIGCSQEVLVEGPSEKDARVFTGRTRTNKTVLFAPERARPGEVVTVDITAARTWTLRGVIKPTSPHQE